jgi:hypothetical protein
LSLSNIFPDQEVNKKSSGADDRLFASELKSIGPGGYPLDFARGKSRRRVSKMTV